MDGDRGVLIGGPEPGPIRLAEPDPGWPERFLVERERILDALGAWARQVEHMGSTAVPGLAAKPIVDVLVAVEDVHRESDFLPALEAAGYELRVREPGHRMFRTPERDVHVHVWSVSSPEIRRHLLFRDWLSASPDDARRYEELKRSLAEREWDDMNDYADAKSPVIAEITQRADAWAAGTGWEA